MVAARSEEYHTDDATVSQALDAGDARRRRTGREAHRRNLPRPVFFAEYRAQRRSVGTKVVRAKQVRSTIQRISVLSLHPTQNKLDRSPVLRNLPAIKYPKFLITYNFVLEL